MASESVSGILGEFMLKGWVLTDQICPNCPTPLMRSPAARSPVVHFCASCDEKPDRPVQRPSLQLVSSLPTSVSSASSDSYVSGTSTPPTEISSTLSSPTFAMPPETAETRRRREQSDRASSEIGKRLLKGWAMLAEECPNLQCFGVPLVRQPRSNSSVEPNSECVICATRYTMNTDWTGRQTLVPLVPEPTSSAPDSLAQSATITPSQSHQPMNTIPLPIPMKSLETYTRPSDEANSLIPTLNTTMLSLERTLQSLAAKLTTLSDGHLPLDPSAIGLTADAINKSAQALVEVKKLHATEMQSLQ